MQSQLHPALEQRLPSIVSTPACHMRIGGKDRGPIFLKNFRTIPFSGPLVFPPFRGRPTCRLLFWSICHRLSWPHAHPRLVCRKAWRKFRLCGSLPLMKLIFFTMVADHNPKVDFLKSNFSKSDFPKTNFSMVNFSKSDLPNSISEVDFPKCQNPQSQYFESLIKKNEPKWKELKKWN